MKRNNKAINIQNIILWVAGICTLMKSVFTEYGYDASYHLAMSWRHINGDRLLGEMWEPHQTSSFILDFFMRLYRLIVPSMTGVALYLQITGAVIYLCVVLVLYKILCEVVETRLATMIAVMVLAARPKGMTLIEFSNMLLIFSILLLVCLYCLYKSYREEKLKNIPNIYIYIYIAMVALCTCLMVLAYPTVIVVFIPVMAVLYRKDRRQAFCYFLICLIAGSLYLLVLCTSNGVDMVVGNITHIIAADSTHGGRSLSSIFSFELDFPYVMNIIFPILMIVGMFGYRQLNHIEKYLWKMSQYISISSFAGVLMLTNLGIYTAFGYLILGASVSLIPISKLCKKYKWQMLVSVCMMVVLARGLWVINGYSAANGRFITNVENIIRRGPTAGIVAPLSIVNETKEGIEDWRREVKDEDTVLAVGGWIMDSSVYLYTGAEIANYSTINTTTFTDELQIYWELYPQKKPTVIAFKSYRGENVPDINSYIGQLIDEKYELVSVGNQWSFYRLKRY